MINGGVAFWPAGTTWDGDNRQVLFGGDFQDTASAPIDSNFTGGGGTWNEEDNFSGVLSQGAEAAIRDCLNRTGATDAILVYPDQP